MWRLEQDEQGVLSSHGDGTPGRQDPTPTSPCPPMRSPWARTLSLAFIRPWEPGVKPTAGKGTFWQEIEGTRASQRRLDVTWLRTVK